MTELANGLWLIAEALQPIGIGLAVVMIGVAGAVYIKDGADGKAKIKENMIAIIIGLGICLLAAPIAKAVALWFGVTVTGH